MARESHPPRLGAAPPEATTPTRRALSADPTPASHRSLAIRTPGSRTRILTGLSASGRKAQPGPSATPHARAAFRTITTQRAAAISTPHRQGAGGRRRSARELRETPRDFLLPLGRVLARNTEVIVSSSSSKSSRGEDGEGRGKRGGEDDEDEEELPKRPRLSLPIDDDWDEDEDLRPHQSAGLEDENFTMQSIEMPRRAYSEQPRWSMGSVRLSEYGEDLGVLDERGLGSDVGIDSGFFPPMDVVDEEDFGVEELRSPERSEMGITRRETLARDSDFGFELPLDMNESTVMLAPQVEESPVRQEEYEPMLDHRSDDDDDNEPFQYYDGQEDGGGAEAESGAEDDEVEVDVTQAEAAAKSSSKRTSKKSTKKVSKYGIEYPSLPQGVVKRLATTFAKTSGVKGKISPDAMKAIMQASDWFFEQIGDDLRAYSKHAHRKTIDESDVLTLMKRQRQTNSQMTPFALAQRHLPRELLQDLRMTPPVPVKKRRKAAGEAEDKDEEVT